MTDHSSVRDQRDQQLDAIIAEYYRAEEAGQAPDHNEFIVQHPEFAKELAEFFADLRMFPALELEDCENPALESTNTHDSFDGLVDEQHRQHWISRGHFFAAAAEAMRRIMVEKAVKKLQVKHGGNWGRLQVADSATLSADERLVALDEALNRLASEDPVAAQVAELRHFAGLGDRDVAAALAITIYYARQKWTYARAWLRQELKKEE